MIQLAGPNLNPLTVEQALVGSQLPPRRLGRDRG